jgi:putative oxidoreductase
MRRLLPLNPDAALLILRVVLGVIMIYHGWPKITGLGGVIEGFTQMGVPLPALAAVFSTVAEFGGGLLLLIGAFTDIAGLLIAIDMLGAIVVVHAKNGFAVDKGGVEWPLALLAMALAIALAGPGRYAVGRSREAAGQRGVWF